MLRDLKLNVFYPYSPEQVWKAIANRRALAAWLMDNDFEPCVGHKFRFQSEQEADDTIYCEVIELDEPKCLSYTWRGSFTCKPTIVTWRLIPVEGGTQVQLEHKGFESDVTRFRQPMRLTQTGQDNSRFKATLATRLLEPVHLGMSLPLGHANVDTFDRVTLNFYLNGGWHNALNNKLQNLLADITEQVASPL